LAELHTIGYEKRSIEEFIDALQDAGIDTLVDVRDVAFSHKPGFSGGALRDALGSRGIDYVHAQFAGNPKWLREQSESNAEALELYAWHLDEFPEIVDAFDGLVAGLDRDGRQLAIMCFERDPAQCHRTILASRWAARARDRRVIHLATDATTAPASIRRSSR
jgi:uncharacterized protein (DUF488 family)